MTNGKNRITLLALCAAMLTMAACGSSDDSKDTAKGTEASAVTADSTAADPAEARESLGLPADLSFGGEDFTFLGATADHGYYTTADLWVEGENAEPLNDAIYKRNRVIEEMLGVKIRTIDVDSGESVSAITKAVEANDCIYDAVWARSNQLYGLSAKGYFLDFNAVPNLDLSRLWWDQNIQDTFSFYDKNFVMTGHISTGEDACTLLVYFNKQLVDNYDLPSPYDMVRDGTWTIDRMQEMVRAVSVDVNGDGKMTEGDTYGLIGEYGLVNRLYMSLGGTYYERKADDTYELNVASEANMRVWDAVYNLLLDENTVSNVGKWKNTGGLSTVFTYARQLFTEDHFLFHMSLPLVIGEFRNMESDFGIVPVPKLDESADRYYAALDENAPLMAITVNAPNLEKTGAVLEAMAWESMYTVTPVYNETLLARKYTRDSESADMLDIIAESRVYNVVAMTDWGGLHAMTAQKYDSKKAVAVSDFEKKLKAAAKNMEKDLEFFAEAGE